MAAEGGPGSRLFPCHRLSEIGRFCFNQRMELEDLGFRSDDVTALGDEGVWLEEFRRHATADDIDGAIMEGFKRLDTAIYEAVKRAKPSDSSSDPQSDSLLRTGGAPPPSGDKKHSGKPVSSRTRTPKLAELRELFNKELDADERARHLFHLAHDLRNLAAHPGGETRRLRPIDILMMLLLVLDLLTSVTSLRATLDDAAAGAIERALDRLRPWADSERLDNAHSAVGLAPDLLARRPRNGYRTLRILGLDLDVTWARVRDDVLSRAWSEGLALTILCVDPDAAAIKAVTSEREGRGVSTKNARDKIGRIREYVDDRASEIRANGCVIEVRAYYDVPTVHGLEINGNDLLWSVCHFSDAGLLVGGDRPYRHVRKTSARDVDRGDFQTFDSWFRYHTKRSRVIVAADATPV
jgi:hypothetical protein